MNQIPVICILGPRHRLLTSSCFEFAAIDKSPIVSYLLSIESTTSRNRNSRSQLTMPSIASFLLIGSHLLCRTTVAFTPSRPPRLSDFSSSVLDAIPKVFIDGEAGTTGLQVRERLASRKDIEVISAPNELRKDEATRKKMINEADAVILCKLF